MISGADRRVDFDGRPVEGADLFDPEAAGPAAEAAAALRASGPRTVSLVSRANHVTP